MLIVLAIGPFTIRSGDAMCVVAWTPFCAAEIVFSVAALID